MKRLIFALLSIFAFSFSALAQAKTCPEIFVAGGGVVDAGTPMIFTAQIENEADNPNLAYEWTISNGTITSGQGTPTISVDTTGLTSSAEVKAEVKIKGLAEGCPATASESGAISPHCGLRRPADEFGRIPRREINVRLIALLLMLDNAPNEQAYIINYGTEKDIAQREKLLRDLLRLRKYEMSRIKFVRGGENPRGETGAWTKFWTFPPGAENPEP